jgi:nucleotidyltransferase/DNA polymerase involved in DNA repair
MERVIIHLDMDAFFASVEQRDNPGLRGKPVVVGADPQGGEGRGVVSTCSYEAREYGIHSAMPISEAYRRCPHAVFLPVDGGRYSEESRRIRRVLGRFTPHLQFVSIDEGYMDVSGTVHLFGGKRATAEKIQRTVAQETGLTASLGVAPCKLVAKIASDLEKPRGLTICEPGEEQRFLAPLPVKRLPGVGPKMQQGLAARGVRTIGDLAELTREQLEAEFGEHGLSLYRKARGIDTSPVSGGGEVKSIGHEHTFGEDTSDLDELHSMLMHLCEKTARRVRKSEKRGCTVTTKIRFEDFRTLTRQCTLEEPVVDAGRLYRVALGNLDDIHIGRRKVRLIGVQVSGFERGAAAAGHQTSLFGPPPGEVSEDRRLKIARAIDAVKDRFGEDALQRGLSLRRRAQDRGEQ